MSYLFKVAILTGVLCAVGLTPYTSSATAQVDMGCSPTVANPCNGSSSGSQSGGTSNRGRIDEGPSQHDLDRAAEKRAQYAAIRQEVDQIYTEMQGKHTREFFVNAQLRLRDILRRQKAVRDGPNVRAALKQNESDLREMQAQLKDYTKSAALERMKAQSAQELDRSKAACIAGYLERCNEVIHSAGATSTEIAAAYNSRGVLYSNSGDYQRAIADYSRSIELDPTRNDTLHIVLKNRAVAYEGLHQYNNAIDDMNSVISDIESEIGEKTWDKYVMRAGLYEDLGNWTRAIADINKIIQLNPVNCCANWVWVRGSAFFELHDYGHAISDYKQAMFLFDEAIRRNPADVDAIKNRQTAARQLAQASEAAAQTNPGASTAEGRAAAAGRARQGGVIRANGALEQAQIAGTGQASTGRVVDGGTAHNDTSATGTLVVVPGPTGVEMISPADLERYNRSPLFRKANSVLIEAKADADGAEKVRASLEAKQLATTEPMARQQIQIELTGAEQAAQRSRGAQRIAENRRSEVVAQIEREGAPEMENGQPATPTKPKP